MSKILVTQSSMPTYNEYIDEIKDIWESKWLTNGGVKHQELEKKLCNYLDIENINLFCNGHQGLYIALKSLNLSGEVITTPFTFASTTHAIVQAGLTPVFCDIDPVTYTIDANKIEELITPNTCAIVPVHVYGNPCDVEKIEQIAKKHNLKVIYDAAHAFGVKVNGKGIANFGDISMFSFHATKVFNTIEGGALAYSDTTLANKINMLKNFGITSPETIEEVGTNAKMNEFSAAMGLCNLRHIDEELAKRKIVFERYISNLKNISGIKLINIKDNVVPNYAYFPVIFDKKTFGKNRDEIMEILEKNNIFTRKYFYPLITDFDCYNKIYNSSLTPVAKEISENVLTLPMYADLDTADVDRICNLILGR